MRFLLLPREDEKDSFKKGLLCNCMGEFDRQLLACFILFMSCKNTRDELIIDWGRMCFLLSEAHEKRSQSAYALGADFFSILHPAEVSFLPPLSGDGEVLADKCLD